VWFRASSCPGRRGSVDCSLNWVGARAERHSGPALLAGLPCYVAELSERSLGSVTARRPTHRPLQCTFVSIQPEWCRFRVPRVYSTTCRRTGFWYNPMCTRTECWDHPLLVTAEERLPRELNATLPVRGLRLGFRDDECLPRPQRSRFTSEVKECRESGSDHERRRSRGALRAALFLVRSSAGRRATAFLGLLHVLIGRRLTRSDGTQFQRASPCRGRRAC